MAPKRATARDSPMPSTQAQTASSRASTVTPAASSRISKTSTSSLQDTLIDVWNKYTENTPQRVKLIDFFMAFLVVVGVLQFVYCVLAGNYVYLARPHGRALS